MLGYIIQKQLRQETAALHHAYANSGATRGSCEVQCIIGMVKKRKVKTFGHVVRANESLANTIFQCSVEGKDHEEGEQDSGSTDQRTVSGRAVDRRGGGEQIHHEADYT